MKMKQMMMHGGVTRRIIVLGMLGILVTAGCSSKNVTATTEGTESRQEMRVDGAEGAGSALPLTGFARNPMDERVSALATMQDQSEYGKRRAAAGQELADIYFAFDKWALSEQGKKNLVESAEFLRQHPGADLVIEGYCDERGSREYNLALGEKRAVETRQYLAALGIKNPVHVTSYGKERPACSEREEACYWKNRRARLVVDATP